MNNRGYSYYQIANLPPFYIKFNLLTEFLYYELWRPRSGCSSGPKWTKGQLVGSRMYVRLRHLVERVGLLSKDENVGGRGRSSWCEGISVVMLLVTS